MVRGLEWLLENVGSDCIIHGYSTRNKPKHCTAELASCTETPTLHNYLHKSHVMQMTDYPLKILTLHSCGVNTVE